MTMTMLSIGQDSRNNTHTAPSPVVTDFPVPSARLRLGPRQLCKPAYRGAVRVDYLESGQRPDDVDAAAGAGQHMLGAFDGAAVAQHALE